MISLGPEFAIDLSAMDAVQPQPGGTAPFAGENADLFNAVLGQLMGQESAGIDGASVDDADASLDEEASETPEATDPTELANPMFVEGIVPPTPLAPVATLVWTIPTAPASTTSMPLIAEAPAALPDAIDDVAAVDSPTGMPSPIEQPTSSSLDDVLAAATTAEPRETAMKTTTPARAEAQRVQEAIESSLPIPVESVAASATDATDRGARPEVAPQIADAINKQERSARPSKQDKAPVEPKLDPAGIRPLPMAAVERAYAGNEQGASKSFDSPREQAPLASASNNTMPAAPAFVVPADGRPMINTAVTTAIGTVDVPASVARDIDTHVPAQIIHSIRMQANNGGGEAIIRLNPDYLGEVIVAVKVEQGSVTASLQAETPAVRQWAERNESVLRQALAEQGLQLDKLTVTEKAAEAESESRHDGAQDDAREEHSQQQPRRRRPQSDEATFEVTV